MGSGSGGERESESVRGSGIGTVDSCCCHYDAVCDYNCDCDCCYCCGGCYLLLLP